MARDGGAETDDAIFYQRQSVSQSTINHPNG